MLEGLLDDGITQGIVIHIQRLDDMLAFAQCYLLMEQGTIHHTTGEFINPDMWKNLGGVFLHQYV